MPQVNEISWSLLSIYIFFLFMLLVLMLSYTLKSSLLFSKPKVLNLSFFNLF